MFAPAKPLVVEGMLSKCTTTSRLPSPKPILYLKYVVRTHHVNFEKNQTNDMTTIIKSAVFRLIPLLGRLLFYTTHLDFLLSSFFSIKSIFNVEFVQEKGLKLLDFWYSPPPSRRRRTEHRENLFSF